MFFNALRRSTGFTVIGRPDFHKRNARRRPGERALCLLTVRIFGVSKVVIKSAIKLTATTQMVSNKQLLEWSGYLLVQLLH